MKKLTESMHLILDNFRALPDTDLTIKMPFCIARKPIAHMSFWSREHKEIIFIRGYSKAAHGLVQRGILMRDKGDMFFWLTTFGIDYIKGVR